MSEQSSSVVNTTTSVPTPSIQQCCLQDYHHSCQSENFLQSSSESCKNTPNISRKYDRFSHSILLKSGSHSAHNSPLPHRRLDKLEGVIRDKPSPIHSRRYLDIDQNSSSSESSPLPKKKFLHQIALNHHHSHDHQLLNSIKIQQKENGIELSSEQNQKNATNRRNTECSCVLKSPENNICTESPRRRVESDCSCIRSKNNSTAVNIKSHSATKTECNCSSNSTDPFSKCNSKSKCNQIFSSPAKSVIGEPGVFSSPIHHNSTTNCNRDNHSFITTKSGSGPGYESVLGEPGIFASPIRTLNISNSGTSPNENKQTDHIIEQIQTDQTVISGWLKFRDNKRVSTKTFILPHTFFFSFP